MMTIDFICEELAELFDSPCNYSPIDEKMFQDSYCESHCGKIADKECWKQYFEKVWADRKTEPQRGCDADCNEDCTECAKETELWKAEQTEPQIDCRRCKHYATGKCKECSGYELFTDSGYVTDCSWR